MLEEHDDLSVSISSDFTLLMLEEYDAYKDGLDTLINHIVNKIHDAFIPMYQRIHTRELLMSQYVSMFHCFHDKLKRRSSLKLVIRPSRLGMEWEVVVGAPGEEPFKLWRKWGRSCIRVRDTSLDSEDGEIEEVERSFETISKSLKDAMKEEILEISRGLDIPFSKVGDLSGLGYRPISVCFRSPITAKFNRLELFWKLYDWYKACQRANGIVPWA